MDNRIDGALSTMAGLTEAELVDRASDKTAPGYERIAAKITLSALSEDGVGDATKMLVDRLGGRAVAKNLNLSASVKEDEAKARLQQMLSAAAQIGGGKHD